MSKESEAEPIKSWESMDVPEKMRHIMWRFVKHPDYSDVYWWHCEIIWMMGNEWQFQIGRGLERYDMWRGPTVEEALDDALEDIESKIEKF